MQIPSIYRMHFFDSEFLQDVVSDSDTRHQQIGRGHFEGKIKRIVLPNITIDHGQYNLKLIAHGAFSPKTVTLMIIHHTDEIGKVCGMELQGGTLIVLPIHADAEFTIPSNTSWTAINVSETHLAKYGVQVGKVQLFTLDKNAFHHFNTLYLNIEKQLSKGNETQEILQDMILSHFIQTVEGLSNQLELQYSDGYLMALNVRDYLIEHITEPLQMYALCQLTNKSVRTIERTFKKVFSMTVREYHSCYRLSLVRQTLIHDKNTSISHAALKHGYLHLSRFASHYKKLFKELPSQTVQRR